MKEFDCQLDIGASEGEGFYMENEEGGRNINFCHELSVVLICSPWHLDWQQFRAGLVF